MDIINDFIVWKKARDNTKKANSALCGHVESITEECDVQKFFDNTHKRDCFDISLAYASAHDDFERYHRLENEKGISCRASSCFYKLYDTVGKTLILRFDLIVSPKETLSCINVNPSGKIYEYRCSGCPHFQELVVYQSLNRQLQEARQKQEIAKQKLLDNFRFWKTK